MKIAVQTACATCAMCTGHAFTGAGRSVGRVALDVSTLGITALARRKCKACTHPMSEHHAQVQQVAVQPAAPVPPPAPAIAAQWRPDPGDPRAWTWWDGYRWHPETKHYPQPPQVIT